jgi:hypothetical protein
MKYLFTIQELAYDKKVLEVDLEEILELINRDHSDDWEPYNEHDWWEGWHQWVEGDIYTLIAVNKVV